METGRIGSVQHTKLLKCWCFGHPLLPGDPKNWVFRLSLFQAAFCRENWEAKFQIRGKATSVVRRSLDTHILKPLPPMQSAKSASGPFHTSIRCVLIWPWPDAGQSGPAPSSSLASHNTYIGGISVSASAVIRRAPRSFRLPAVPPGHIYAMDIEAAGRARRAGMCAALPERFVEACRGPGPANAA